MSTISEDEGEDNEDEDEEEEDEEDEDEEEDEEEDEDFLPIYVVSCLADMRLHVWVVNKFRFFF